MRTRLFARVLIPTCLAFLGVTTFASAQEVRDPMRPPAVIAAPIVHERPTRQALILQSTKVMGPRRSAVINGMNVGIGDMIGEARVVSINVGAVRLITDQNETIILEFAPRKMKIPADAFQ